jgi:ribosome-associated toxin RatA of RatAB toxin-antitoxin module
LGFSRRDPTLMRSTLSIDIAAPARLVFDLARDVERWPDLLPHYLRVRVEERSPDGAVIARFMSIRPIVPLLGYGIPVAWRSRTWSDAPALRLRFVHQGGATSGMDVTWRIEETTNGCRVSIDHDFDPRVPVWPAVVNRLFVQPIATRTLASFRAIAEAVAAEARPATPQVAEPPSAKPRPARRPPAGPRSTRPRSAGPKSAKGSA